MTSHVGDTGLRACKVKWSVSNLACSRLESRTSTIEYQKLLLTVSCRLASFASFLCFLPSISRFWPSILVPRACLSLLIVGAHHGSSGAATTKEETGSGILSKDRFLVRTSSEAQCQGEGLRGLPRHWLNVIHAMVNFNQAPKKTPYKTWSSTLFGKEPPWVLGCGRPCNTRHFVER